MIENPMEKLDRFAWPEPWGPVAPRQSSLERELRLECGDKSRFHDESTVAVGKSEVDDDVVFATGTPANCPIVIHLTWSGRLDTVSPAEFGTFEEFGQFVRGGAIDHGYE